LLSASNEFTRRLYENVQSQQSAAGGAGGNAGPNPQQASDDEVADAEIIDDNEQSA
jgi:hypothetical protein